MQSKLYTRSKRHLFCGFLFNKNTPFMIFSSEHNILQPALYPRAKCTAIVSLLRQVDVDITNPNGRYVLDEKLR